MSDPHIANPSMSRRAMMATSSAAVGAMLAQVSLSSFVFANEQESEELVPFLNMPRSTRQMLDWETLDSWITPQDQVFSVAHYNKPDIDPASYHLEVTGLVERPIKLTFDDIKKLPRENQLMTLECSGNGVNKGFMAAIYNSKWTGTPLATLLKSVGVKPEATEVVFLGADRKEEKIRNETVEVPFGRSLPVKDAFDPKLLLAYERNGDPLAKENGAPLRLIVPGHYGIANVKWITRIELRNRRYMGRFMGRDYVTLRGERKGDSIEFVETSVGRMNLKSIVARVTQREATATGIPLKAYGAVWGDGTPIDRVEVKVDDGPWQKTTLDKEPRSKYCWTFFSIDLGVRPAGKHTIVSRAIDANGRVQPTVDDDEIKLKKTYWEAYAQWPREIELEA